jgi:glucokinase
MQRTSPAIVLAADAGGTHTRMGLYRAAGAGLEPLHLSEVASRSEASLEQLLRGFLAAGPARPDAACIAIAGPIVDGTVDVTNLPWRIDAASLARELSLPRVRLLNDLEAAALGMQALPPDAFAVLQPGSRAAGAGHVAVVAAGTGFGEAALVWDGEQHHPAATEAGHTSYAPRDEPDLARWRRLRDLHGHVSLERVVSGPGLADTYAWLREQSGEPEPGALRARIVAGDAPAAIAEAGLRGDDPVCAAALACFVRDYGAAAGDAALRHLALGGVILAGGIAPKILPALEQPGFLTAFRAKGRFEALLASLRVSVCIAPNPALEGAARLALRGQWS